MITNIKYIPVLLIILCAIAWPSLSFAADGTSELGLEDVSASADSNNWAASKEVSAVGAAAARSREVLNWVLAIEGSGFSDQSTTTNINAPSITKVLSDLWIKIRNLMSLVFVVMLIAIGFGIILRTDWGVRSRRLLPYIIIALIVMNFSFIASATVIRLTDKLQHGFYRMSGEHLQASNLLTVHFNYQDFQGYRLNSVFAEDAVRNHLWLVRLTTYTNYTIAIILIIRIVILWGLVIFSPFVFPLLIFPATRRVAVVWVREFFRWLFLGPLIALFLSSVAYIWANTEFTPTLEADKLETANKSGVPIDVKTEYMDQSSINKNQYYSGTNLLLSPPGSEQAKISMVEFGDNSASVTSGGNNLTDTDTYIRFIIALIMLWSAIILPFLLLRMAMVMISKRKKQISQRWESSSTRKYLSNLEQRFTPGVPPPRIPKPSPKPGLARPIAIPGIARPQKVTTEIAPEILREEKPAAQISREPGRETLRQILRQESQQELSTNSMMQLAGLTQVVPQITQISQTKEHTLEHITTLEQDTQKIAQSREIMEKIAKPEIISSEQDKRHFQNIHNMMVSMSTRGITDARHFQNAITNNISNYLTTNINEEVQKNVTKNFAQQIKNVAQSDTQSNKEAVQNFQQTYNTQTSNLTEYLGQKSISQHDEKATSALQALQKVAQMVQIASKPVSQITQKDHNAALDTAQKLQNPESIAIPQEKEEFRALRGYIDEGTTKGNPDVANMDYMSKLLLWAKGADDKDMLDEKLDSKVLEKTVKGDKDFQKSKELWKKHYAQAPVPLSQKVKNRKEWLEQEKAKLSKALNKILSQTPEDRKAGLEEVKKVIPFMLMGDYSLAEIAKYLMAKIAAIDDTLKDLERMEGPKESKKEEVLVPVKKKEKEQQQAIAQKEPNE